MPKPATSVVVLSYRPGSWLADCLASVVDQADEVILVDNASPDAEASAIGHRFGVHVVAPGVNLGFGGGVNLGLRHARGDVVALLNDDATAGPDWLAAGCEVLEDPTVAAVTPKVRLAGWWRQVVLDRPARPASTAADEGGARTVASVTINGDDVLAGLAGAGVEPLGPGEVPTHRRVSSGVPFYVPLPFPGAGDKVRIDGEPPPPGPECRLVNNAGSFLERDGHLGDHGEGAPDDGRFDTFGERFAASGAALMARADTFVRLGPLAARLFAYYEDSDWSWRARLAGMRVVYDPRPVVEHRRSATSGGGDTLAVRRLAERNRHLVVVRNAPAPVAAYLVGGRIVAGPYLGIRRAIMPQLPWAVATRVALSRRWQVRPEAVWERWAGADTSWDARPAAWPH